MLDENVSCPVPGLLSARVRTIGAILTRHALWPHRRGVTAGVMARPPETARLDLPRPHDDPISTPAGDASDIIAPGGCERGLPGTVFRSTVKIRSRSRPSQIAAPRYFPLCVVVTLRHFEGARVVEDGDIASSSRPPHPKLYTQPAKTLLGAGPGPLDSSSRVRISQGKTVSKDAERDHIVWPRPHPHPSTSPRVVASSSVRAHTMWSSARSSTRSASSWRGCPRCVHPRTVASLPFYQLANTRSSPLRCRSPSPRTRVSGSPARCTIVPWRSPAS
jgi:hypothetical protein